MTSFEGPSFDLGIDDGPEDLSLLIVEDSLDKNEDTNQDQDVMFGDEVMSYNNDEAPSKQTEVFEDVAFARRYKNKFDLNEVPNEDESSMNVCGEVEETTKSNRVKSKRAAGVVIDLNEVSFEGMDAELENEVSFEGMAAGLENELSFEGIDASHENKVPFEGIDVGLEDEMPFEGVDAELKSEDVKKEIEDVMKIYLGSWY